MREPKEVAKDLTDKILQANKILVISSRPADQDSIGSNLSLSWWIKNHAKKNVDSVIFSDPKASERLIGFPDLEQVKYEQISNFKFDGYDLIICLDGAKWGMFFQDDWATTVKSLPIEKTYLIDHHHNQGLDELTDRIIQYDDCCTAKIVYDLFIKPSGIEISAQVATWMYFALIDDTGRFIHEVYEGTYEFAATLWNLGADHIKATDENMSIKEMQFMVWATEHADFDAEIETTILAIDLQRNDELDEVFGSDWRFKKLYRAGFVEKILRKVRGFNYGVMFTYNEKDNSVHAGWRTRTNGGSISIQEVLIAIGFDEAGGHFGAGGGTTNKMTVDEIVEKFKAEMKKRLGSL